MIKKSTTQLFNKANEPIVIVLTADFLISDINTFGAKELFQKNKDELINKPFIDLLVEQNIDITKYVTALDDVVKQMHTPS